MPRTSVSETNRNNEQPDQFPRLKLANTGDMARLLVPDDENAWMEFVHGLRAPTIGDDGKAVIVPKKKKNGDFYDDYDMGFVGQRICLGDPSILETREIDPDRCPACAAAKDGIKDMKPQRRYAVPVIRYKTVKLSDVSKLQNPPSAEILIWALTQGMYNKLLDVKPEMRDLLEIPETGEDGKPLEFHLRVADIVVVCEDANFSRLGFKAPLRPAHRNARIAELVRELWGDQANRPSDIQLKQACGREGDRSYMMIDVDQVRDRWRMAEGLADPTGGGSLSGNLDAGLGDLADDLLGPATDPFDGHPGGTAEFAKPEDRAAVAAVEASDDLFADSAPAPAAQAAAETAVDDLFSSDGPAAAGAAVPAAASNGSAPKVQSFDDILGG